MWMDVGYPDEGNYKVDNSWKAFRIAGDLTTSVLTWTKRQSKKEKEEGEALTPELIERGRDAHRILAVRGVPIGWKHGYSLYNNDRKEFVCKTTHAKIVSVDAAGKPVERNVDSDTPLDFPVKYIAQYGKNEINQAFNANPQMQVTLYGSRGKVDTDPTSGPAILDSPDIPDEGETVKEEKKGPYSLPLDQRRTCAQCIAAGENEEEDGKFRCKLGGYMLFAVMQIGHEEYDSVTDETTINWHNVADSGFRGGLNAPFILRFNSMGTMLMFSKVGSGNRDIELSPSGYVPTGVMSPGEYRQHLNKTAYRGYNEDLGFPKYGRITELYWSPIEGSLSSVKFVPTMIDVEDPEVIDGGMGWTETDWMDMAHQMLQAELSLANGEIEALPETIQNIPVIGPEGEPEPEALPEASDDDEFSEFLAEADS